MSEMTTNNNVYKAVTIAVVAHLKEKGVTHQDAAIRIGDKPLYWEAVYANPETRSFNLKKLAHLINTKLCPVKLLIGYEVDVFGKTISLGAAILKYAEKECTETTRGRLQNLINYEQQAPVEPKSMVVNTTVLNSVMFEPRFDNLKRLKGQMLTVLRASENQDAVRMVLTDPRAIEVERRLLSLSRAGLFLVLLTGMRQGKAYCAFSLTNEAEVKAAPSRMLTPIYTIEYLAYAVMNGRPKIVQEVNEYLAALFSRASPVSTPGSDEDF